MNKKKKSTNISPYPDEAIKRLARAFYPAILACWNSEEGQRSLVGARPLHLLLQDRSVAPKPHWGFHCCAAQTRVCLGRQNRLIIPPAKKKTERSRRGTPCCTYRYRLWSFAGCVLFRVAPCFFTMIHHFPRAASGIRHQHGSGSDAAHPGIVPIFCAGMPCKLARMQCHFPAYCPIRSA